MLARKLLQYIPLVIIRDHVRVTSVATMMHCLDGGTDSRSTLCVNLIYFNNDNLSKLDLSIGMIGLLRFGSNKFVLVYKYKGGGF